MSKVDELLALADRCEAASEGSLSLENDIAAALDRYPREDWTRSLDAALSLVPEGLDWAVDVLNGKPGATVFLQRSTESFQCLEAATPALALCAAALRARAAGG